jgi:hypothetical protein
MQDLLLTVKPESTKSSIVPSGYDAAFKNSVHDFITKIFFAKSAHLPHLPSISYMFDKNE